MTAFNLQNSARIVLYVYYIYIMMVILGKYKSMIVKVRMIIQECGKIHPFPKAGKVVSQRCSSLFSNELLVGRVGPLMGVGGGGGGVPCVSCRF